MENFGNLDENLGDKEFYGQNENHSETEINKADEKIRELATYEIAQGKILVPASLTEYAAIQAKIAHKFNYFKYLIKNGETTLDELVLIVKNKYGAFPTKSTDADNFTALINDIEANEKTKEIVASPKIEENLLDTILNAFGRKNDLNKDKNTMYNDSVSSIKIMEVPLLPLNPKNPIDINETKRKKRSNKASKINKTKNLKKKKKSGSDT